MPDEIACTKRGSPRFCRACKASLRIFGPLSTEDRCVIRVPGQNIEVPAVFISWIYDESKTEPGKLFDRTA